MKREWSWKKSKSFLVISLASATFGLTACNGAGDAGARLGTDQVVGTPAPIPPEVTDRNPVPTPTTTPDPTPSSTAALGPSCRSNGDPNKVCLSLKYVVYKSGTPVISQNQALTNLAEINKIWSQCNIAFEFGEYVETDPTDYGLTFNTTTSSEFSSIRRTYGNDRTLLIVTTGTWAGTLGSGSANAWTTMPGGGNYGVIMEAPVGDYPNIIAHEIGHYLNLDHVGDSADVMNAVIYSSSTNLTSSQCSAARAASINYWTAMLR